MKLSLKVIFCYITLLGASLICTAFKEWGNARYTFPYKQAGLTKREAIAHLLNRFTYGARPGDIDEVLKIGMEKWFQQQLEGNRNDDPLHKLLDKYEDINLTNTQVEEKYPNPAKILKMAIKDAAIHPDSINKPDPKTYNAKLKAYIDIKGYKELSELKRQLINQKILRAAYTNNQLREILTDFWFNHFNISITKVQGALFVPAFERDVIRPNVTGKFSTLLLSTAKSPAMLFYLDNYTSSAQPIPIKKQDKPMFSVKKQQAGLNENYAREVMELHTLGVDGGYTQSDVTQAARVLTGWTIAPMGNEAKYNRFYQKLAEKNGEEKLEQMGYKHDGDFLFVPAKHDNQTKTVLNTKFPAGGGYQEGVDLLNLLAHHPATAKFLSKKLAIRFVSDQPPQSLIDKMAKTFSNTDGDIKQVLITMVNAPEFWAPAAIRQKTKSPFELAISAVRTLDAEVTQPFQVFNWINRMGQKIYYYQAPTGFPDKGQYWINTGSLLNRMNFGLALASQKIPGIKINLSALNNNHEPESAEAALFTYSKIMIPERDLTKTITLLTPLLNDPDLSTKVQKAAVSQTSMEKIQAANTNMLAQVVGLILGSPEFQRK